VAFVARIKLAVYLGEEEHKLGPGKVRLLEAIEELGSISAAARSMGMAYRHAWELVDDLNQCFASPVVAVSIGGREGGGAVLTPWGHELVKRFHHMEEATRRAIGRDLGAIVDGVALESTPALNEEPPPPRKHTRTEGPRRRT
jgi:molybdate transport system regulatory protein